MIFSRIKANKSSLHEITPMSFDLQELLQEIYYIHTRSGAKKAKITVVKVHEHEKPLLPHIKPEKQLNIISNT